VQASLPFSYLWEYVHILSLTTNERVRRAEGSSAQQQQQQFADFLLALGEGRVGPSIQLPVHIFIPLEAGIPELAGRVIGA
jgi:ATP-dependent DNA helicase PIF1